MQSQSQQQLKPTMDTAASIASSSKNKAPLRNRRKSLVEAAQNWQSAPSLLIPPFTPISSSISACNSPTTTGISSPLQSPSPAHQGDHRLDLHLDQFGFPQLPHRGHYQIAKCDERRKWVEQFSGTRLTHLGQWWEEPDSSAPRDPSRPSFSAAAVEKLKGNIENPIGLIKVPCAAAGPLLIHGDHMKGLSLLPIATTEGALVASITRGATCMNRCGGVRTSYLGQKMVRTPRIIFATPEEAQRFIGLLRDRESNARLVESLQKHAISKVSKHAKLISVEYHPIPDLRPEAADIRFEYTTGDATGQNMTTTATAAAMALLVKKIIPDLGLNVERHVLEGNLACDKKASWTNYEMGRGARARAEINLTAEAIRSVLKVEPEDLLDILKDKPAIAKAMGSIGFNINVANVIAGAFMALGQDVASVHESSVADFNCKPWIDPATGELGVTASMYLPCLLIGTVGGGTALPTQRECLEMIGCYGQGGVARLAEILAGYCLALDLSTLSAIVSDQFAVAHERLGRNRPDLGFRRSMIDNGLFHRFIHDRDGPQAELLEWAEMPLDSSTGIISDMSEKDISKLVGHFGFRVVYRPSSSVSDAAVAAVTASATATATGAALDKAVDTFSKARNNNNNNSNSNSNNNNNYNNSRYDDISCSLSRREQYGIYSQPTHALAADSSKMVTFAGAAFSSHVSDCSSASSSSTFASPSASPAASPLPLRSSSLFPRSPINQSFSRSSSSSSAISGFDRLSSGPVQAHVVIKSKPTDRETIQLFNRMATNCGGEVAKNYEMLKFKTGLRNGHVRELEVSRYLSAKSVATKDIMPYIWGVIRDDKKEIFLLAMERLIDTTTSENMSRSSSSSLSSSSSSSAVTRANIKLLNSTDRAPQLWKPADLQTVLSDLAGFHAVHIAPISSSSSSTSSSSNSGSLALLADLAQNLALEVMSRDRATDLLPLRMALLAHNSREFPALWSPSRTELARKMLRASPDVAETLFGRFDGSNNNHNLEDVATMSPLTLVHGDFNPRNVCIRLAQSAFMTANARQRMCAYDWELATLHLPQRDIVEFLAFTLDPTVSRQQLRAQWLLWLEFSRQQMIKSLTMANLARNNSNNDDDNLKTTTTTTTMTMGKLSKLSVPCNALLLPSWLRSDAFVLGAQLAMVDFVTDRLASYTMAHTFKDYSGFLPRVLDAAFGFLETMEFEPVACLAAYKQSLAAGSMAVDLDSSLPSPSARL